MNTGVIRKEYRHYHGFCGVGGGAKGFNRAHVRVGRIDATMRCIGGVDLDASAIADFNRQAGVPGTVMDLFTVEQFRMFHGPCKGESKRCPYCHNTGEPPAGWREAGPDDIRRSAHGERPHVVFCSSPCQGNSGMIADNLAATPRYVALNELMVRFLDLVLAAWEDDPPELIICENVPRISQRSPELIADVKRHLELASYVVHESYHDCGELGGLAQRRKRWLLVARYAPKVRPYLYEPPKQRVRGVGEVLGEMPLPNDPRGGPMHRIPALKRITWERLALIPAGEDWRALAKMDLGRMRINRWGGGVLGVTRWELPCGAVKARSGAYNGPYATDDPRIATLAGQRRFSNVYRIQQIEETSPATARPPTLKLGEHSGKMQVVSMAGPVGTITTSDRVGSGLRSVADERLQAEEDRGPRRARNGVLGVVGAEEPAGTRLAESHPSNGANAYADHRIQAQGEAYGVNEWSAARGAVINERAPGQNKGSVADPRVCATAHGGNGKYRITEMAEPTGTVMGRPDAGNGAYAVAEDRVILGLGDFQAYGVCTFDTPSATVTAQSSAPGSGAHSVQDVRVRCKEEGSTYQTQGHYGVRSWADSARTVTAAGQHDNGAHSVADERLAIAGAMEEEESDLWLIDPRIPVIISLDNTWHRPFTPLENAALQGFDWLELAGDLVLGGSDTDRRKKIGNAVPPPSAEAIGCQMLRTLIAAHTGQTFRLSAEPIWVRPLAVALALPSDGVMGIAG